MFLRSPTTSPFGPTTRLPLSVIRSPSNRPSTRSSRVNSSSPFIRRLSATIDSGFCKTKHEQIRHAPTKSWARTQQANPGENRNKAEAMQAQEEKQGQKGSKTPRGKKRYDQKRNRNLNFNVKRVRTWQPRSNKYLVPRYTKNETMVCFRRVLCIIRTVVSLFAGRPLSPTTKRSTAIRPSKKTEKRGDGGGGGLKSQKLL